MKLTDLSIGEEGFVEKLEAKDTVRRRLLDIGLVEGTRVKVMRRSPLGDPTLYLIRGTMIALRKEEAQFINIIIKEENENGIN
ncbi:ferrous iron transport protein A [Desulfonispora thiosulfatigenes DSM 11270]|uniref:Ferrous iron transport protein A n=1 Tax=Desulfonispora thiosulfatigenes DSM 11270 TaxID=656914 RepID=A0A1W1UKY9_DESTI|nr:ferrous iron transport protein A [Desulfonispora thiosulfatigenes DSM 11270]